MEITSKVSIIVPIYNVEPYLHKCVDSIINQTYKNLEIILVDDGSPDGCPQICDEYREKDGRVIVIHKENGGLSDARNAGLDVATGEYVTFIDSDDWYEEDAIKQLVRGAVETNADIVCMGFFVAEDGLNHKKDKRHLPGVLTSEEYLLQMCEKKRSESVWDKLFRMKYIFDLRFRVLRLNEDFLFLSFLLLKKCKIYCVDYWGYNYYKRTGSITNSNLNSIRDGIYNATELMEKASSINNIKAERAFAAVALFQARTMLILISENDINNESELFILASQTIKELFPNLFVLNRFELRYIMEIALFRALPKSGPTIAKRVLLSNRQK